MVKCQRCNDLTFIIEENEAGEEEAHPCDCRIKKDREMVFETKLVEANIKKKYSQYTIKDYLEIKFPDEIREYNRPQIEIFQKFLNDPKEFINTGQVLWLWGKDPNAGHTTLSIMLGVALIQSGYKVRFFKIQNLLDAFTEFEKKEAYFTDLKKFDVYIIDDAFVADRSHIKGPYTKTHLFNFIDNALCEDKHFIITSDKLVDSIGSDFEQVRVILRRSIIELELRGSIIEVEKSLNNAASKAREEMGNMGRK